mmetsp:Transcript_13167/g.19608  ORF Transcript_13167/g.19608 Transcript_13167/m.19608 type:complete len:221 (-) Transcript_13167:977-1639(-)
MAFTLTSVDTPPTTMSSMRSSPPPHTPASLIPALLIIALPMLPITSLPGSVQRLRLRPIMVLKGPAMFLHTLDWRLSLGLFVMNYSPWRKCLITTTMSVEWFPTCCSRWSATIIRVLRERRWIIPHLLYQKVETFSMNFHLEEGWRIKSLLMNLGLLIGVPRRCWPVDTGMVFVLTFSRDQMLESIATLTLLMLHWKSTLPTWLCLINAPLLGFKTTLGS